MSVIIRLKKNHLWCSLGYKQTMFCYFKGHISILCQKVDFKLKFIFNLHIHEYNRYNAIIVYNIVNGDCRASVAAAVFLLTTNIWYVQFLYKYKKERWKRLNEIVWGIWITQLEYLIMLIFNWRYSTHLFYFVLYNVRFLWHRFDKTEVKNITKIQKRVFTLHNK